MKTDVTALTGPSLTRFTSQPGDVCDASDGQSGPSGLMARTESLAGFAVKIFMKEHKVAQYGSLTSGAFTKDRGKGGSGPRRRRLAIRHVERVLAPRRGCGRPETPNRLTPGGA